MKSVSVLLFSLLLLAGCASSKQYLHYAQYDIVLSKSVKKLHKKPNNSKQLEICKESFEKANAVDNDHLKFLQASKDPDIWEQVYTIYNRMKARQQQIKNLPATAQNNMVLLKKITTRK